jgi:hypothetical protein
MQISFDHPAVTVWTDNWVKEVGPFLFINFFLFVQVIHLLLKQSAFLPLCFADVKKIFLGTRSRKGGKYTKTGENIPNGHKIYQMTGEWRMENCKTLQNLPKLGFLF